MLAVAALAPKPRQLPTGVALRSRKPTDAGDLFGLFNERGFLDNALMRDPFVSPAELNQWLDGVAALRRYEVVAVHAGRCVGFAALYGQVEHFDHCGVVTMGVRAAFRGRGVGDLMLAALVATARRVAGFAKLHLTVVVDNAPAIALYRKHGFEIEGFHRRFARQGGTFVDAFSMALMLDA
jgi:L-phenylalanine/L-methionine N-acetyltransferase